jgi:hypothetical protein
LPLEGEDQQLPKQAHEEVGFRERNENRRMDVLRLS